MDWEPFKAEVKLQRTTQEWVAGKAGISPRTLQGWILNNREPKVGQLLALAKVLDRPIHTVFPSVIKESASSVPTGMPVGEEWYSFGNDKTGQWIIDHRQVIEDLRVLTPEVLETMEAMIHTAAEIRRRELGKDSASG